MGRPRLRAYRGYACSQWILAQRSVSLLFSFSFFEVVGLGQQQIRVESEPTNAWDGDGEGDGGGAAAAVVFRTRGSEKDSQLLE